MTPRLADVQAAMQADEVVAQIRRQKHNFRKRLYMVSGVRIARGARLSLKESRSGGAGAGVGFDLTAVGAPGISMSAQADVKGTASQGHSFESASDFVYAYRLVEIHYSKDVFVVPYQKGETHGVTTRDENAVEEGQAQDEEVEEERILVEGLASEDYAGVGIAHETFSVESVDGTEDEEAFILAI